LNRLDRRTFARVVAALAGAAGGLAAAPGAAIAGSLTNDERAALERGEVVRRPVDADLEDGLYQGGVSYALVDAPAAFVLEMLANVGVYTEILALTLEANPVGEKGSDKLVFFKHGGSLGTASYTMRVRREGAAGVVRFWMDPAFDHEIDDIWGYVRIDALGPEKSLATYAVLCNLGMLFRVLFGERIRQYALDTPGHIRNVAGSRYQAAKAELPSLTR
jgi:hypothetical protein